MSTRPVLVVRGLTARIAGQQVLEDVSLEVPARGVTALLGRNGVGKTSTLKALMGLIERSGTIELDGEPVDRLATHKVVQRGVGYVPEDREVFGSLTVAENLRLAERSGGRGGRHGVSPERRELVGDLFPDIIDRSSQRAGTLSGGQQQMVALARALLNENRLLLVDEPTKGLSPRLVGEVTDALEKAAQVVPVLLVEQNLTVARRLAGDAVVLDGGRVVHAGPAADLLDDESRVVALLGVGGEPGQSQSQHQSQQHDTAEATS
ncbi:ABC transporter ATP-binding protein [Nocardioides bruguierae]|uniref:ABC transporter ATP-binding protein n=1 Tax=Nocardioides bruguierae TaxID=2945102 RepID=UPI00202201F2|nr:ABC transporter ATP-binding protein [Nocardioides bruguierae]MCL8025899.1 ABC transporter ATP-binding protein [Nocardioides bruguierae]